MIKVNNFTFLGLFLGINIFAVLAVFVFLPVMQVEGQEEQTVLAGIGWISFSDPFGDDYAVTLNANQFSDEYGYLTGNAWANPKDVSSNTDNFGLLSFDEFANCPAGSVSGAPNCEHARVDFESGSETSRPVVGWTRFISADPSGGWDGWVSLAGGNGYGGVTFDETTGMFSGYAWGGSTVGWINFSPPETLNQEIGQSGVYLDPACLLEDPFDYELDVQPSTITLDIGESVDVTIFRDWVFGTPESVEISMDAPSIANVGFALEPDPDSLDCTPEPGKSCLSNLRIDVLQGYSGPTGPFLVTIFGNSDNTEEKEELINLNIDLIPDGGDDPIICEPNPTSVAIGETVIWTAYENNNGVKGNLVNVNNWSFTPPPSQGNNLTGNQVEVSYSTIGVKNANADGVDCHLSVSVSLFGLDFFHF